MALDLKDFRGKITPETACALEAESRATGKQQQEIVRQILAEWAAKRLHAASVLQGLMRAEGLTGANEGRAGSSVE